MVLVHAPKSYFLVSKYFLLLNFTAQLKLVRSKMSSLILWTDGALLPHNRKHFLQNDKELSRAPGVLKWQQGQKTRAWPSRPRLCRAPRDAPTASSVQTREPRSLSDTAKPTPSAGLPLAIMPLKMLIERQSQRPSPADPRGQVAGWMLEAMVTRPLGLALGGGESGMGTGHILVPQGDL